MVCQACLIHLWYPFKTFNLFWMTSYINYFNKVCSEDASTLNHCSLSDFVIAGPVSFFTFRNEACWGLNQIHKVWPSAKYENWSDRACAQVCFPLEHGSAKVFSGPIQGAAQLWSSLAVPATLKHIFSLLHQREARRREARIPLVDVGIFLFFHTKSNQTLWKASATHRASLGQTTVAWGGPEKVRSLSRGQDIQETAGFRNPRSLGAPSVSLASASLPPIVTPLPNLADDGVWACADGGGSRLFMCVCVCLFARASVLRLPGRLDSSDATPASLPLTQQQTWWLRSNCTVSILLRLDSQSSHTICTKRGGSSESNLPGLKHPTKVLGIKLKTHNFVKTASNFFVFSLSV